MKRYGAELIGTLSVTYPVATSIPRSPSGCGPEVGSPRTNCCRISPHRLWALWSLAASSISSPAGKPASTFQLVLLQMATASIRRADIPCWQHWSPKL